MCRPTDRELLEEDIADLEGRLDDLQDAVEDFAIPESSGGGGNVSKSSAASQERFRLMAIYRDLLKQRKELKEDEW